MNDVPLLVFSRSAEAPPLRDLLNALRQAEFPVSFSTETVGEAQGETLVSTEWEAVFVRWKEPEMHEVALLERMDIGDDEEGLRLLAEAMNRIVVHKDEAGRLIVAAHLQQTQTVYALQLLDALFTDEDHPAWGAFDVLLRVLADTTDGLIYAESEGYLDPEGELILSDNQNEEV